MPFITVSMVIFFVLVLVIGIALDAPGRPIIKRAHNRKAIDPAAKPPVDEPEKPEMSWAASQLVDLFNNLPQESRPALDIETAVRAIDFKYGVNDINRHYTYTDWNRYSSYGNHTTKTWNCYCVYNHDTHERLADICSDYPEFWPIKDAIQEVRNAIYDREMALKAHERAMELAGIEDDLRTGSQIADALKAEAAALAEVTKEYELR